MTQGTGPGPEVRHGDTAGDAGGPATAGSAGQSGGAGGAAENAASVRAEPAAGQGEFGPPTVRIAPPAQFVTAQSAQSAQAAQSMGPAEPTRRMRQVQQPPQTRQAQQHPHAPQLQQPQQQPGQEASDAAEGYTPTQRDLPVLDSAGTPVAGPEPTLVDVPSPASGAGEAADGPLFVVGDVHGYLDELRAALLGAGIIDGQDRWIAGNTRLWFLGDFTDRGPDGIGVIDLVMSLSAQAAAAGGYCKALLGNHEVLLIGAKRFGDTPVNSGAGTASFQAAWLLNGGQRSDMERLQDHHIQWMSRLDAMALADDHLLVHSDATCYLEYGETTAAVNDSVTAALESGDADEMWDLFRKFTKRFAFRDEDAGVTTARELLSAFGGRRIVHGHSPIPYLLGEVGSQCEDEDFVPDVTGPHVYADGLAVAMDGGVTMAGKLLISQLPLAAV